LGAELQTDHYLDGYRIELIEQPWRVGRARVRRGPTQPGLDRPSTADDREPQVREEKDGRPWRIGGETEVAWIRENVEVSFAITSAKSDHYLDRVETIEMAWVRCKSARLRAVSAPASGCR
jgi:hypothetical protein